MGKPSRDKGARGERLAVAMLKRCGFDAQRCAQRNGMRGSGDIMIHGLPWLLIEVKYGHDHISDGSLSWAKWIEQARSDCEKSDATTFILLRKRTHGDWAMTFHMRINGAEKMLTTVRGENDIRRCIEHAMKGAS